MVMEFVPGGELFGHLRAAGRFNVAAARFYVACDISALDHLHRHDIVYRCRHLLLKLEATTLLEMSLLFCMCKSLGTAPCVGCSADGCMCLILPAVLHFHRGFALLQMKARSLLRQQSCTSQKANFGEVCRDLKPEHLLIAQRPYS